MLTNFHSNRRITGLEHIIQLKHFYLKTTGNFLDVRPFKVDLIRTERKDSLDKLESITFKLYISLMDLTFVLILEPRKKVHSNHASPNGNSNDECKIEASSSLFRKYHIILYSLN